MIQEFGAVMLQVAVPPHSIVPPPAVLAALRVIVLAQTQENKLWKILGFEGLFSIWMSLLSEVTVPHTNHHISAAKGTGNTALSHPAPSTTKLLFITRHQPLPAPPLHCRTPLLQTQQGFGGKNPRPSVFYIIRSPGSTVLSFKLVILTKICF